MASAAAAASGAILDQESDLLAASGKALATAEEYEHAAFKALAAKKRKTAEKTAAARKRPAAAPLAAPSAEVLDVIIVPVWTKEDGKKAKRFFQSKAYHQTLNHGRKLGLFEVDKKSAAQAAYQRAGVVFDKKA